MKCWGSTVVNSLDISQILFLSTRLIWVLFSLQMFHYYTVAYLEVLIQEENKFQHMSGTYFCFTSINKPHREKKDRKLLLGGGALCLDYVASMADEPNYCIQYCWNEIGREKPKHSKKTFYFYYTVKTNKNIMASKWTRSSVVTDRLLNAWQKNMVNEIH